MILVQVAGSIAALAEFTHEDSLVFLAVHFDEKDRAFLAKQALGTFKNGDFRTFDITLDEVWCGVEQNVLIKRNGFDRNDAGSRWFADRNVTKTTVRRYVAVHTGKRNGGWLGPNSFLLDNRMSEFVIGKIFGQARGDFGICFEGKHSTGWTDQARGQE